jgi:hopanoid biosynthesis associated protein HpnK
MNPPLLLIVNADDFGLAAGTNAGVAQAFDHGLVRSASLLAGAPAAAEAARLAAARPGLGVGVHLALTQVAPVLPAAQVPSLIGGGEHFLSGPRQFAQRLLAGRIVRGEILAEFVAQLERARDLGIRISHVDSHQHLHLLPVVRNAFVEAAQKFGIQKMRLPRLGGPARSLQEWLKALVIDACRRTGGSAFRGLSHPDKFWGLACSGDLTRARLLAILEALTPGAHELMTHPAAFDPAMHAQFVWGYRWEDELAALCDPAAAAAVERRGVRLGNFHDLATAGDLGNGG